MTAAPCVMTRVGLLDRNMAPLVDVNVLWPQAEHEVPEVIIVSGRYFIPVDLINPSYPVFREARPLAITGHDF